MRTWCQKDSQTLFAKGDRLANSRDVNPLETIWIIVNETTYKDHSPPKHWTSYDSDYASPGKMFLRHTLGARTFYTSPLIKYQKT